MNPCNSSKSTLTKNSNRFKSLGWITRSKISVLKSLKPTKDWRTNSLPKIEKNIKSCKNIDKVNADEINKYFVEIGKKLSESCSLPSDLSRVRKLENSMFLTNVTAKEVFDIIKQMPKKISSDLHNISNQLIKFINPSVCETFAKLINRCFDGGHFPRTLKIANIYLCTKMVTKTNSVITDQYHCSQLFQKLLRNVYRKGSFLFCPNTQ